MDEYALAGKRLFHALKRRAVPPPIINEACTAYLLSLSEVTRSANPVHHILRFSTYILHHGHSKLGTVLRSTAIANNIGCELVEKMTCTKPQLNNISANSKTVKSVPSAATQVSTDVDGSKSEANAKTKKPSRYARMKKKWISIQESDDEGKEFERMKQKRHLDRTSASPLRSAAAPVTQSVEVSNATRNTTNLCNLAVTNRESVESDESDECDQSSFERMLGQPVQMLTFDQLVANKLVEWEADNTLPKMGSKIGNDANPPTVREQPRSASVKEQIVQSGKPGGSGMQPIKRRWNCTLAKTPKVNPKSKQKGCTSAELRAHIAKQFKRN